MFNFTKGLSVLLVLVSSMLAAQPTIVSFSPAQAKPGDVVSIIGTNFGANTSSNIVYFGAAKAQITSASSTNISATVPVGATFSPISVLNTSTNLISFSTSNFNPIYSPVKTSIALADFAVKQDFTTATRPACVAVGDLDGDGKVDMVSTNQSSTSISVLRNTSNATSISFATKVDYTTGSTPYFVKVADIDNDGKLDIAVANLNATSISVFRNTSTSGAISFASKSDFTVGTSPRSITLADFDSDGKLDMAVVNNGSNTVSVLRNTSTAGTIGFATKADFTVAGFSVSIAMGDIDTDGKVDLVVANQSSNNISVLRNTSTMGTINFAAKVEFAANDGPVCVAVADMDADSKLDVVVANSRSSNISVLKNTSINGTVSFAARTNFATGTTPNFVSIGDVDGDAKPDVTTANYGTGVNTISVLRNNTTTSIGFESKVDVPTGSTPISTELADINGDSRLDIVNANYASGANSISVLRNVYTPSTNANLSSLVISDGSLSPSFVSTTTEYTVALPNNVSTFSLTPTISNANATMRISFNSGTFTTITSGVSTQNYSLNVGQNTFAVRVTAEDGTTIKEYSIFVTRATSSDANLSSLTINTGTLSPAFSSNTTEYTVDVLSSTQLVTLLTISSNSNATVRVRINGDAYSFTRNDGSLSSGGLVLNVGANTINVQVTAQDGTTIKVYTITVNRPTNIADLSALVISSGTLTPTFSGGIINYSANVINTVSTITVRPTIAVANATVRVNVNGGTFNTVANNSNSSALALNVGSNTINVQVTAANGTTIKTYTITVTRALSNNANLSNLTTSVGFLVPIFGANGTSYTVLLQNNTSSITITPTRSEANATIQYRVSGGGYISIASGTASAAIPVSLGNNLIDVMVTAHDGTTTKTYTINALRPSNNADLSNLTISAGSLSPVFSSNTTEYVLSAILPISTNSLTITPTASEANAVIRLRTWTGILGVTEPTGLNGVIVNSGSISTAINLLGNNTIIEVSVTAQDGTTSKIYNIRVARMPNSNANLTTLSLTTGTLSPTFSTNTTAYTANVSNSTTSIRVNFGGILFPGNFQVRLSGGFYSTFSVTGGNSQSQQINLAVGSNTIELLVTAQDGVTTKLYTITVIRAGTGNLDLSGLSLSEGTLSPLFSSGILSYTTTVANAVTGITVTPTKVDAATSIQVGIATPTETVTSGTASSVLPLNEGVNVIQVKVSNTGGNPSKTYTIRVERLGNAPTVTSFTPTFGKPGDIVTINGTNFRDTQVSDNIVYFGTTKATISAATSTQLTVVVPSGVTHAPITVINTNTTLSASSAKIFNPIYAPSKTTITAGDFGARQNFQTGFTPASVAFGDMDGDGKPDMVTTDNSMNSTFSASLNNISIFLNTSTSGAVSFAPRVRFTNNLAPQNVKLVDIDGDGMLDMIVQSSFLGQINSISVFRNSSSIGNISFSLISYLNTGSKVPTSLSVGDIDGDGKPEIVVGHTTGFNFSVFRNTSENGTISFATPVSFPINFNSGDVGLADFDGDGKLDVLTSDYTISRNTSTIGTISFAPFKNIFDAICNKVTISDIDGDGKLDVIGENASGITILKNNSNIGIINFDRRLIYTPTVGITSRKVEVADINGDNKPDIVLASFNNSVKHITVHENTSINGVIHFAPSIIIASGTNPSAITICDIDGDSKPDLAVTNNEDHNVSILRNTDIVLPIILSNFSVSKQNNTAVLQWTSAEETNAKNYQIEMSVNGISFSNIGSVNAKGFASSYSFNHHLTTINIASNTIYYRLKLVDNDGTFSYSSVKTIELQPNNNSIVLYPNPVKEKLTIVLHNVTSLSIYTIDGKIKQQQQLNGNAATTSWYIANYAKGIYFLRATFKNGTVETRQFIKE